MTTRSATTTTTTTSTTTPATGWWAPSPGPWSTTSPARSSTSPTPWWSRPTSGGGRVDLRLHVAPDDMGKIIGKRGRVAQAIRTVVRAAGAREGVEASVDIVD